MTHAPLETGEHLVQDLATLPVILRVILVISMVMLVFSMVMLVISMVMEGRGNVEQYLNLPTAFLALSLLVLMVAMKAVE